MKKNPSFELQILFYNFWKVLASYEHFWVTYAKTLKKKQKFAQFPKISIENSLIIQECGQIWTCVFLQKFRNVIR